MMETVRSKVNGYEFFEKVLGSPRYVCAPMVEASELAFRTLVRRYSCQLTYTPMFHAKVFVRCPKYRADNLTVSQEDRPLIVQFCANDPDVFVAAAKLAAPVCDAIDLNLGCPQGIAKRGHYGAFLQDDWELLEKMINAATAQVPVPITCKVRVFPDVQKSIEYAKMLERAGCSLLTVHGRIREQKGPLTGLADWDKIKAIKEAVSIPVIANGNIQSLADAERCLKMTGVDGVMSAEGLLYNPALFSGKQLSIIDMSLEYIACARSYPCPLSFSKGHLFKILHRALLLEENFPFRDQLSNSKNLDDFEKVVRLMAEKYSLLHGPEYSIEQTTLPVPIYCTQPYFRPPAIDQKPIESVPETEPRIHEVQPEIAQQRKERKERKQELKRKKQEKFEQRKKVKIPRNVEPCPRCRSNCKAEKCENQLCKPCCRELSKENSTDCENHKFFFSKKPKPIENSLTCVSVN